MYRKPLRTRLNKMRLPHAQHDAVMFVLQTAPELSIEAVAEVLFRRTLVQGNGTFTANLELLRLMPPIFEALDASRFGAVALDHRIEILVAQRSVAMPEKEPLYVLLGEIYDRSAHSIDRLIGRRKWQAFARGLAELAGETLADEILAKRCVQIMNKVVDDTPADTVSGLAVAKMVVLDLAAALQWSEPALGDAAERAIEDCFHR
jgi:hypothetical protein